MIITLETLRQYELIQHKYKWNPIRTSDKGNFKIFINIMANKSPNLMQNNR